MASLGTQIGQALEESVSDTALSKKKEVIKQKSIPNESSSFTGVVTSGGGAALGIESERRNARWRRRSLRATDGVVFDLCGVEVEDETVGWTITAGEEEVAG